MLRLLLGSLLAAVLMFGWGFLLWVIVSDRLEVSHAVPADAEEDVVGALKQGLPVSGRYFYPSPPDWNDEEAMKKHNQKHAAGPIVEVFFHREGIPTENMSKTLGFGFVHYFLVALLLGNLLLASGRQSFLSRLALVTSVGVIAAVLIDGGSVIWWHHPWRYQLFSGVYHATLCLLGGLPLAALVKPRAKLEALA